MEKKEQVQIAIGIVSQIFDYLIDNGIDISVDFRQKHNDKLYDYVAGFLSPAQQTVGEGEDRKDWRLARLYLMNYMNIENWDRLPKGAKEPLEKLIDRITEKLPPQVSEQVEVGKVLDWEKELDEYTMKWHRSGLSEHELNWRIKDFIKEFVEVGKGELDKLEILHIIHRDHLHSPYRCDICKDIDYKLQSMIKEGEKK